ncbi:uncharacterized protein LOC127808208 isoform X2 [Diospyros lotus]|uniref:uncharacterized protein LOC127808208 isoform X2 n=1 Tax=Diospyros lotus TaxID=55363 RepID=UPI00225205B2|nr:uncharacterized protein LOC127808208 isoform X2 [Diospyros lotus]
MLLHAYGGERILNPNIYGPPPLIIQEKYWEEHPGQAVPLMKPKFYPGPCKVGVTGFCMGGALSIASSVLVPEVDAVVAFYGVPSSQLADPSNAKAPVQAHFGELDSFVGFSDVTNEKDIVPIFRHLS